jgi:type IV pilus assembly protein PilE
MSRRGADRQRGVSLIELMIALTVLAIVVSVAVPGYRQQVIRTHRAEAKQLLLSEATALERCFMNLNAYNGSGCPSTFPRSMAEGRYQLTGTLTAGTFTISAVPQGEQAKDMKCKTLTLTHRMAKGVAGGATQTAEWCWRN